MKPSHKPTKAQFFVDTFGMVGLMLIIVGFFGAVAVQTFMPEEDKLKWIICPFIATAGSALSACHLVMTRHKNYSFRVLWRQQSFVRVIPWLLSLLAAVSVAVGWHRGAEAVSVYKLVFVFHAVVFALILKWVFDQVARTPIPAS